MYNFLLYTCINYSLCTRHCARNTDLCKTLSMAHRNSHISRGGKKCKKLATTQNVKGPGYLQNMPKCFLEHPYHFTGDLFIHIHIHMYLYNSINIMFIIYH